VVGVTGSDAGLAGRRGWLVGLVLLMGLAFRLGVGRGVGVVCFSARATSGEGRCRRRWAEWASGAGVSGPNRPRAEDPRRLVLRMTALSIADRALGGEWSLDRAEAAVCAVLARSTCGSGPTPRFRCSAGHVGGEYPGCRAQGRDSAPNPWRFGPEPPARPGQAAQGHPALPAWPSHTDHGSAASPLVALAATPPRVAARPAPERNATTAPRHGGRPHPAPPHDPPCEAERQRRPARYGRRPTRGSDSSPAATSSTSPAPANPAVISRSWCFVARRDPRDE
jgi:hypothetical protein